MPRFRDGREYPLGRRRLSREMTDREMSDRCGLSKRIAVTSVVVSKGGGTSQQRVDGGRGLHADQGPEGLDQVTPDPTATGG